ncbi:enoyl-CoA hydratase/isomerase family protein [Frankia sp. QA3]|uniref:enoyl-CoA hydratase/isomerase family protein n=1 Tax=Frankia sp. QA3 TaxID=710111 RepID=UPI000269BF7A|nr:enoyl-CoA hydratase-related protein [Frankia sp. QA3]EIV92859.1 enoyl-CoA hydratase/carnithine racemase [Frankia sp. QA3]
MSDPAGTTRLTVDGLTVDGLALDGLALDVADGVLRVRLDRPGSLNSLTGRMRIGLAEALRWAAGAARVRVVVLTGTGRAFCAGQDLGELATDPDDSGDRLRTEYAPLVTALGELDKPVLAAVNGACAGAALSLVAGCDLRIAAQRATFVPAFVDLGLVPDAGGSYHLPRLLGRGRALAWLASGRRLSAAQAYEIGLVDEVVPDGELDRRTAQYAASLAARSAPAVEQTKRLLRAAATASLADQLEAEARAQHRMKATAEHAAALASVLPPASSR